MADKFEMLINGNMVEGSETFPVLNPSTGEVITEAPHASKEQTELAVAAAKAAFPKWSALSQAERAVFHNKAADIIADNIPAIAELLVKEQGKPLARATEEVQWVSGLFKATANLEAPVEVLSETDTARIEVRRKPIGVVVGIAPWNFPMFCSLCKLAPAVSLGNTFVLKPSPFTPLTALKVGGLLKDAYPAGVVNVVSGSDKKDFNVGAYLSSHPDVRKVSFTGSVSTGKKIYQGAANDVKRITLEMGGNDAAIIRSDFDVAKQGENLFAGTMANTGQVCVAIKRVYCHEDVYDQVVEKFVECAKKAKVGDGFQEGVEYGPLNNLMQLNKVKEFVEDARNNGANILTGGAPLDRPGYFYPPTVITNVKEGHRIVDEEQFGPVIPIMSYKDDEEAIERANNSSLGLGGSVWGSDVAKANELASKLEAGTVWVNTHLTPTGGPFGGMKQSGIGRELSSADVLAYTECQTVRLAK
eukprot:CAMPEP_0201508808 /NCGR_PEP_ID=MMETSP0161_2-20130828/2046_1 /ASSEMBLY_ACC=CAM_ASM_000251 /TAXON_ID=180227 /ORGANISM="Neoparamoeba aestuarina, Strain SoJaBio B1-5/56/2" /LENGTH=472 /DNA_ID=CAMNT_0047903573 /DNA_START=67 /DNA_END=1485 /DNA_ORIENTATION=-